MPPWPPPPSAGSATAARSLCAACTTSPPRWPTWSACGRRRVCWGWGWAGASGRCLLERRQWGEAVAPQHTTACLRLMCCPGLRPTQPHKHDPAPPHMADLVALPALPHHHTHTCTRTPPLPAGLSGLSAGTLHVVLTGEGEAALVMSEEAHALLRQQNVDAYAPSGGCGWLAVFGGVLRTVCVATRPQTALSPPSTHAPCPTHHTTPHRTTLTTPRRLRGPAASVGGPQGCGRLCRRPGAGVRGPAAGRRLLRGERDEQARQAGAAAHRLLLRPRWA